MMIHYIPDGCLELDGMSIDPQHLSLLPPIFLRELLLCSCCKPFALSSNFA